MSLQVISVCPITADVHCSHLIKVESTRPICLFHGGVLFIHFAINKHFVGETLKLCRYAIPHQSFMYSFIVYTFAGTQDFLFY